MSSWKSEQWIDKTPKAERTGGQRSPRFILMILLHHKVYIPIRIANKHSDYILDNFSYKLKKYVDPSQCKICAMSGDDYPCETLGSCPFKEEVYKTYKKVKIKGKKYIQLWRGNLEKIEALDEKILDRRSEPYAKKPRFTGQLYKAQIEALLQWVKKGCSGTLQAPARSGKTVMGAYVCCKFKTKTLVLVHEVSLGHQFLNELKEHTDMDAKIAVSERNIEELTEHDIVITTYQILRNRERLIPLMNHFGLIIVDESHLTGAATFSRVVSTFNPKYILALTATPIRKDGKHVIAYDAVGPVVAEAKSEQMTGTGEFIETGISVGTYARWTTLISKLCRSIKRDNIITDKVIKDVEKGHYVLMVTDRVMTPPHCHNLQKMLKKKGYDSIIYTGKTPNRLELLNELKEGKHKICIATRHVVKHGLNVKPWSAYHCLTPTTNIHALYQEMSRIRTPMKGKLEPVVRFYIDNAAGTKSHMRIAKTLLNREGFTYVTVNLLAGTTIKGRCRTPIDRI